MKWPASQDRARILPPRPMTVLSARNQGRVRARSSVHRRLQQALDSAFAAARPGDAILFSPAFASFDQYPNFRARALEFHGWLASRRARGTAASGTE